MMGWFRRHPIFSLFFLALAGWAGNFVYTGYFNMKGYCWDEARYLSEDELIENAARSVYRRYPPSQIRIPGSGWNDLIGAVEYKSFNDFMSRNQNCCKLTNIGWKGSSISIWHRMNGKQARFVRITYIADAIAIQNQHIVYVPLRNCGGSWRGY